ncbi:hypothetical protein F4782DRAFT_530469 [Xylaria castorea]|nr:hypothetical protein F4782DRAFT_530469 [Xylaria castorea]
MRSGSSTARRRAVAVGVVTVASTANEAICGATRPRTRTEQRTHAHFVYRSRLVIGMRPAIWKEVGFTCRSRVSDSSAPSLTQDFPRWRSFDSSRGCILMPVRYSMVKVERLTTRHACPAVVHNMFAARVFRRGEVRCDGCDGYGGGGGCGGCGACDAGEAQLPKAGS